MAAYRSSAGLSLAGALLLAMAAGSARAAESTDLAALSLEQLMEMNVHSVYGVSKYKQRVTQAPASISIVNAEEIRRYGYTNLADVLQAVRGLYVTNDRNYTYLGMRGFLRPGDYTTRILVLIDGHRLNDNVYDYGSIGREMMIDVELIERIEVIRGPSSSVYGSSAFLGVINVITKQGKAIDGTEAAAEVGSFDTYRTRLTYGDTFDNGADWIVSASHYTSGGENYYYPVFDQRISDYSRAANNGIAAGLDDEEASKFFSSLRYGNFNATVYYSDRSKQVPTASFETVFASPDERTRDKRGYVELGYTHDLGGQSSLKLRGFYDLNRYEGTFPYNYAAPGDPPFFAIYRDFTSGDWLGTEVQFTSQPSDRLTLVLGGEYRENLREDQYAYDDIEPRVIYLDSRRSSSVIGAYAQGEMRLRDDLSVTAGLRHDYYADTFGGTTNPRVAVIYNPSPHSAIKAMYGQAFRAPNPYERYYFPEQSNANDLDPETVHTYDLAYERYFGSIYRLSLSAYYYDINGLITQAEVGDGDRFYANLDDVSARGLQFELVATYPGGTLLNTSLALQRVKNDSNDHDLSNSPRSLAKFNVSTPLFGSKLYGGLQVQYNGSSETRMWTRSPSFVLTNLTLNTRKLWSNVELTAGIFNVFDKDHPFPAAEEHAQLTLQQAGRTYSGRVLVRF